MKLIMVDLDGTLIDTKEVNYLAYKEALEPYGYSLDYEYYCAFCNGKHYLDFLPQITTTDGSVLQDIHKRKKCAYSKYLHKAAVNKGLAGLIKKCRGDYKTALVTTASGQNVNEILECFKLRECFDLILTHEDISRSKPDPEGFLKAMAYFDAGPEECMIFEDSDVGIKAAEQTGATLFVVRGFN